MRTSRGHNRDARKRRRQDDEDHHQQQQPDLPTGCCVSVSKRYEKLGRLGEGTYGVVYKARDRITNTLVALKRCIPHYESSDGFPITALREIHSLRVCRSHPNVVHLAQEEVAVSKSGVFLVLEHCEYDLADLVDAHYSRHHTSPFTEPACKRLLRQLLSAVEFLHAHHILHRDIKLSNLLYSTGIASGGGDGLLKLADFGLSRRFASTHVTLTPTVASLWYRPPELLLGATTYNETLDTWACGCIFAELLKGRPLFPGKDGLDQLHQIMQRLGVPTIEDWPGLSRLPLFKDGSIQLSSSTTSHALRQSILDDFSFLSVLGLRLLLSLLAYNPDKRWSAETAGKSTYFSEDRLPTDMD